MKKNAEVRIDRATNQDVETAGLTEYEDATIEIDENLLTLYFFGDDLDKRLLRAFRRYFETLKKFSAAKQPSSPITIEFCTNGGEASVSLAIYDIIKSSGLPIRTVALGEVISGGVIAFLGGQERLIHKNSILMTHKTGNSSKGSARLEQERTLAQLRVLDGLMRRIILKNSNLTARQLKTLWRNESFITAEEAVKYGLAHKII